MSKKSPAGATQRKTASAKTSGGAASGGADQALDSAAEGRRLDDLMARLRAFAADGRHARGLGLMRRLGHGATPQSLMIEGGTEDERYLAALYWAALLNCDETAPALPSDEPGDFGVAGQDPCLACHSCRRMAGGLHRDCFLLDGRTESIKIDSVREMRAVLGEEPGEARKRVVILAEAENLVEAAANALLKSLEEPRSSTSFVLTVPQRERLLPTLVSRSWILTLPWPKAGSGLAASSSGLTTAGMAPPGADAPTGSVAGRAQAVEWGGALLELVNSGRGWMERTQKGQKGGVTRGLAHAVLLLCQEALVAAMRDRSGADPLSELFAALPPERQRILDEVFAECQESLFYTVNPALVLDWLATRVYLVCRPASRAGGGA